jgi:hypothetical protein
MSNSTLYYPSPSRPLINIGILTLTASDLMRQASQKYGVGSLRGPWGISKEIVGSLEAHFVIGKCHP